MRRLRDYKEAQRKRDKQDNVYAEAVPPNRFGKRDCELVTLKIQTNLAELLGVEDLDVYGEALSKLERDSEFNMDEDIDEDYAKRIIDNVIEGMADTKYKKKRRRLPE